MKVKTQVYKSALDLAGETVDEFLDSLRKAAKEQLSFPNQSDWLWLSEVRASTAIFTFYDESEMTERHFEHQFSRGLEGKFEFSEGTEVEKLSYWTPKQ